MTHPDDEVLAALVLDEPHDPATTSHVETCPACRARLGAYRRTAAGLRHVGLAPVETVAPAPDVWDRITAELSGDAMQPVHPSGVRRGGAWLAGAAGFAVGVAAALVGVAVVAGSDDGGPSTPEPRVIAQGRLTPYEGRGSTSGKVSVLRDARGRSVRVDISGAPRRPGTFVEAWLLDARTNDMLALGVMRDPSETFPVPDGLDLTAYSSVDISLEPVDGNPAHSADSLSRGRLHP